MELKGIKFIKNGEVADGVFDLSTSDGIISAITPSDDFCGLYVSAGFVDMHTHGAKGYDFSSAYAAGVKELSKYYFSHGVTHFCPTFVATPLDELSDKLLKLYSFKSPYAEMLRAHLEGPFISLKHKGAQPAENIKTKFEDGDAAFFEDNEERLAIVTFCPATVNADKLLCTLSKCKIKAQGGHDDSRYPDIEKAVNGGMDGVTHIFCGCSTAERGKDFKKYLGLSESGLLLDQLTVEVIADDEHISKQLFELIYKCKGKDKICLVSDSLSCAGMKKGNYKLGDRDVYTDGKVCYLADMSSLAGSVTSVGEMIKIVTSYGIPLSSAAAMAAETPRTYLGIPQVKFEVGEQADFAVLNCDGKVMHAAYKQNEF